MTAATPVLRTKFVRDDGAIIEMVIWQLDSPVAPCSHRYKYRPYFGSAAECFVRYDNERGKGDHRHVDGIELPYTFTTPANLLADFEHDITHWSKP